MSFRAYLDDIQAQSGKRPQPQGIAPLVKAQGLTKPCDIITWAKSKFGHGHSMVIVSLLPGGNQPRRSGDEKVVAYFSGAKARWRTVNDRVVEPPQAFGADVSVSPGVTCLSLVKAEKSSPSSRRSASGWTSTSNPRASRQRGAWKTPVPWNTMVTHRV
jgi:hypothetical protein